MTEEVQPPDPAEPEAVTPPPPGPPPPSASDYPLTLNVDHQAEYSRFMPLIKWLLLLPHYIVLILLWIVAVFAVLISFFAVLITGRYPRGLFDFVLGVGRWSLRVQAYGLLMTDRYPPFSIEDDAGFPARLSIDYPEDGVARWRPLIHWILVIPYSLIAGILGYLMYLMALFAFFTILFTKRYPEGLFKIALVAMRWQARAYAYEGWMVTKYPPFVWE